MGPTFRTPILELMPNDISKIKQNSSEINEIILAPCDVISKIKQNSSDMNEIILAPCDAGYVQSYTGFLISLVLLSCCKGSNQITRQPYPGPRRHCSWQLFPGLAISQNISI
jgi:hypothetical protein